MSQRLLCIDTFRPSLLAVEERLIESGYEIMRADFESQIPKILQENEIQLAILPMQRGALSQSGQLMAKAFKSACPEGRIVALYCGKLNVSSRIMLEYSDEWFSLPFEEESFFNRVFELQSPPTDSTDISIDNMSQISAQALFEKDSLPYDVYVFLPRNQKLVLYRKKNTPVDEELTRRLSKMKQQSLYVLKTDLSVMKGHLASTFFLQSKGGAVKEISEQSDTILANFSSQMFVAKEMDLNTLSTTVRNVDSVVKMVLDASKDAQKALGLMKDMTEQQHNAENHARNVAVYCCVFGPLAGLRDLATLYIGGLMHDIGFGFLPLGLQFKDQSDMTEDEKKQYQQHPKVGLENLKEKGSVFPDSVLQMVYQHHEHEDGSGFPNRSSFGDISKEAKICSLANEFDKMTSVRTGFSVLTPAEALMRFAGFDGGEASPFYSKEFHKPIIEKLLKLDPDFKKPTKAILYQKGTNIMVDRPKGIPLEDLVKQRKANVIKPIAMDQLGLGVKLVEHFKTLTFK